MWVVVVVEVHLVVAAPVVHGMGTSEVAHGDRVSHHVAAINCHECHRWIVKRSRGEAAGRPTWGCRDLPKW